MPKFRQDQGDLIVNDNVKGFNRQPSTLYVAKQILSMFFLLNKNRLAAIRILESGFSKTAMRDLHFDIAEQANILNTFQQLGA